MVKVTSPCQKAKSLSEMYTLKKNGRPALLLVPHNHGVGLSEDISLRSLVRNTSGSRWISLCVHLEDISIIYLKRSSRKHLREKNILDRAKHVLFDTHSHSLMFYRRYA